MIFSMPQEAAAPAYLTQMVLREAAPQRGGQKSYRPAGSDRLLECVAAGDRVSRFISYIRLVYRAIQP